MPQHTIILSHSGSNTMKRLLLVVLMLAMVVALGNSSNAQSKLALGVGADLLLPMGTFGDNSSIGFGGSVRGQYDVSPMASVGLTVGYFTWSGKDITTNGVKVTAPKFSGLPIRAFGKYYFMPEGEKVRFYGMAELGMFFWSVGDATIPAQTITVLGFTTTIPAQTVAGGSGSDFNYAPGVGAEFALGSGSTKLDISARYDAIAAKGATNGSIGARVGVVFPLGN